MWIGWQPVLSSLPQKACSFGSTAQVFVSQRLSYLSQPGGFFALSISLVQTAQHITFTHGVQLLPESPSVLAVLQLGSTLVPLGLAEGLGEPLHLGAQLPHIPLQIPHLALPLGLAALQLLPQLMPALLQLLQGWKDECRSIISYFNIGYLYYALVWNDPYRQQDVRWWRFILKRNLSDKMCQQASFRAVKDHGKCMTAGTWMYSIYVVLYRNISQICSYILLELKLSVD